MSALEESTLPLPEGMSGVASRVATAIRLQIIEGVLLPGDRLPEERMRGELSVSRSTLREGFHLLIRERLLVHRLSRGFFVRELSQDDISDLYAVRRVIECGALQRTTALKPAHLRDLAQAVAEGQAAADQGNWHMVAAASIGFHKALVALVDSDRLSGLIDQVLAEFRLSYAYMDDPGAFHAPFLVRNAAIAEQVSSGDIDGAAAALDAYFEDAERALLEHYAASDGPTKTAKNGRQSPMKKAL